MHEVQRDVESFHRALDIPVGDSPGIRDPELRASLIAEETRETLEAITGQAWKIVPEQMGGTGEPNLIEAIDGMCDILCVVYGTAVSFGIDLGPFWHEVHRTNMAKKGGPVREDGKRLKPTGWTPPDLLPILAAQQQPEWAQRYSYLCLNCGEISPADRFGKFSYDEEGERHVTTEGEEVDIERCPACDHEHTDDDANPGFYADTRFALERQRKGLLVDYADQWIEMWQERAKADSVAA